MRKPIYLLIPIMQRCMSFFFILLFCSCDQPMQSSVAGINDEVITLTNYISEYKDFLQQTNLQDNLANRFTLLHSLIDEVLIIDYMHRTHSDRNAIYNREKQRMYDQLLLNEYYDFTIGPQMTASDQELRTLFAWSKTTLHVRHLYAQNLSGIKDIQDYLKNGNTWEECAAISFKDSLLQSNGGDLGWMRMGDMDPAFESAAFQLTDMQISSPIKTQYGYSIIQVLEKEKDGFLTEQEFQLEKDWLRLMAAQYKKMPAIRDFTDTLLKQMEIHFNEKDLKDFFSAIIANKESQKIYSNRPLLSFNDGHYWTAKQTYEKLDNLSSRQYKRIQDMDNLTNILKGLAVREKMLLHAEELHLSTSSSFTESLERQYHNYLVRQCLDNLFDHHTEGYPDPSLKQSIYKNFRDGLAANASISIDTSIVKKFILPPGETS